jgi:hypothetical protein
MLITYSFIRKSLLANRITLCYMQLLYSFIMIHVSLSIMTEDTNKIYAHSCQDTSDQVISGKKCICSNVRAGHITMAFLTVSVPVSHLNTSEAGQMEGSMKRV